MRLMRLSRMVIGLILCSGPVWAQASIQIGPLEPAPAGGPVLLRVMTYNLHHGANVGGDPTLDDMARLLRDGRLDLVGLQEVDRNWSSRSGFGDQAALLAAATGLHVSFFPTIARDGDAGYGLAILSRQAPVRQLTGLYRVAAEPRGYLAIETEVAGRPLSFVVTHLGLDTEERGQQAAELAKALTALPGPLVLVGDFNCRPDDPAAGLFAADLRDVLAASGRGLEGTFIAADGKTGPRIDFIFATPEFRIEQCSVPEVDYSDHRPILADLTFYHLFEGMGGA